MLFIVHLICVVVFVLLGIAFWNGKGAFLIAGYNTSSREEKEKTDEKKLCRFMGKFMFVLAAGWLIVASGEIFKSMALLWIGLGFFMVIMIAGIVYANTGNRFKR